ncbi:MAG: hypothetical protein GY708_05320 [Actinomycetia bacterium]|nr:hypothetical protein [Actinomycetes bacterium]MCP4958801.1 hypothetical protein [Actinomycetes bacterium]
MSRARIERKLSKNVKRLKKLRSDVDQLEAEYAHMFVEASDSERFAAKIEGRLSEKKALIAQLEATQDALLDEL